MIFLRSAVLAILAMGECPYVFCFQHTVFFSAQLAHNYATN
jgi:hypothetical protein